MALFICILQPAMSFLAIISFAAVISFMPMVLFSPAGILSMSALAFIIFASVQSISAAAAGAIERRADTATIPRNPLNMMHLQNSAGGYRLGRMFRLLICSEEKNVFWP